MSFPFSEAHGGVHAESPVPPATYAYMFACTSTPARRAESIFAIAARPLGQLRCAGRLEMIDLDRHAALRADRDGFVDRLEELVAPRSACA